MSTPNWSDTVPGALRLGASVSPDRVAFVFEVPGETERRYTYAQLHAACLKRAASYLKEGLRKGDASR